MNGAASMPIWSYTVSLITFSVPVFHSRVSRNDVPAFRSDWFITNRFDPCAPEDGGEQYRLLLCSTFASKWRGESPFSICTGGQKVIWTASGIAPDNGHRSGIPKFHRRVDDAHSRHFVPASSKRPKLAGTFLRGSGECFGSAGRILGSARGRGPGGAMDGASSSFPTEGTDVQELRIAARCFL